jgi:hypothetical protein
VVDLSDHLNVKVAPDIRRAIGDRSGDRDLKYTVVTAEHLPRSVEQGLVARIDDLETAHP